MAEHHGLLHGTAHFHTDHDAEPARVIQDCAAVVHGAATPLRSRDGRKQQAGHWRQVYMNTGMRGWTVHKIRAHQSLLRGDRGLEERTRVLGNHWADVLAKEIATN
eukprot:7071964-Pyramimonas_sp.AAC.1